MRKPEIVILCIGLALPFIGNVLGAILWGKFPFYLFYPPSQRFSEYLTFLFVLESLNLIPIILCIMYSKGSTTANLKRFKYAPIVVTYLFIIYCHYEVMALSACYTTAVIGAGLLMLGAPFLSIPVFFIAFMFSLVINLPVIRREEKQWAIDAQSGNDSTEPDA